MMDVLLNHRSVRKFTPEMVSESVLKQVLEAGIRASNTGNMQVYSVIVSRDELMRQALWTLHMKQPCVLQAPVHLTFCADVHRFSLWCKARKAEPSYENFLWFYTATIDAVLVSQNVAIAAESVGLGICYLGTINYFPSKFVELLRLPKGVFPVAAMVIGRPDGDFPLTDRLPLEGIVHNEWYHDYSSQDIDRIFEEKEQLDSTKALLEINQKETLAQIFTDNRYPKDVNVQCSEELWLTARMQMGLAD